MKISLHARFIRLIFSKKLFYFHPKLRKQPTIIGFTNILVVKDFFEFIDNLVVVQNGEMHKCDNISKQ